MRLLAPSLELLVNLRQPVAKTAGLLLILQPLVKMLLDLLVTLQLLLDSQLLAATLPLLRTIKLQLPQNVLMLQNLLQGGEPGSMT